MRTSLWLLLLSGVAAAEPYVVKPGDALSALCRARYGNEHYDSLLALHNRVEPDALRAGQTLDLPTLDALVAEEQLGEPAALILQARSMYLTVEKELLGAPSDHSVPSAATGQTLREAGRKLLEAASLMSKQGVSIAQPKSASILLYAIAEHGRDVNGYDLSDFHRRVSLSLEALLRARIRSK